HRRQVAEHFELALAERLEQLGARHAVPLLPAFEDRQDVGREPGARCPTADQLRQRLAQRSRRLDEGADAALRLGELERPLEWLGRGVRSTEGAERDRLEHVAVDASRTVEALLEAGEGRERVACASLRELDAREG